MALMMGSLYEALRAANVPDDKAQKAAEEIAARETDVADLKGDVKLLKWMVGAILALEVMQFARVFIP